MSKEGIIEVEGKIIEVLPNQMFNVELTNKHKIVCYTGGKMRKNRIRIVAGDKVQVEMSPYDMGKGRIIYRM